MFVFEKAISSFNRHQYARERDQKNYRKNEKREYGCERYENVAEDEWQSLAEYTRNYYIRLKNKAPVSSYNSKNEATLGMFRLRFLAFNYKTSIFHNFFPLIFCLIYKNNGTSISQILSK